MTVVLYEKGTAYLPFASASASLVTWRLSYMRKVLLTYHSLQLQLV